MQQGRTTFPLRSTIGILYLYQIRLGVRSSERLAAYSAVFLRTLVLGFWKWEQRRQQCSWSRSFRDALPFLMDQSTFDEDIDCLVRVQVPPFVSMTRSLVSRRESDS